jgi:hypothetical protein
MKNIKDNWNKIKSTILWYFNFTPAPNKNSTFCEVVIPLTKEGRQRLGSVIEKSGVKNMGDLLANSVSLFEKLVDHELNGGSVDLVDPNGVNKEKLELLRQINGDDEAWKDWDK